MNGRVKLEIAIYLPLSRFAMILFLTLRLNNFPMK